MHNNIDLQQLLLCIRHIGNNVSHTNKVKLRRAWLVLELVTTSGVCTIPAVSRPTQPGHPSVGIGAMSTSDGVSHRC